MYFSSLFVSFFLFAPRSWPPITLTRPDHVILASYGPDKPSRPGPISPGSGIFRANFEFRELEFFILISSCLGGGFSSPVIKGAEGFIG